MSMATSSGCGNNVPLGGRRSVVSATLCVPELLDAILGYCPQKGLAASACVSRLWFEHAIDALWWHIDGLEPFIHLFQTLFLIEEESVAEPVSRIVTGVSDQHPPPHVYSTEATILRFLQYCRRVRAFTLSTTVHLEVSPNKLDLWKVLLHRSSWGDGFPNLRYLDWTPRPHKPFQVVIWMLFVSPFMNSAVNELRIYVPYDQGALHSHELTALPFLFTGMSRMVALTYLELRMDISVQTCEAELVELLHQLKNLRDLNLPGYWNTSRVLEAISEMPHLCGFQSIVDETSGVGSRADLITVRPALRQGIFAQLSSLSLCASMEDVLSLLGDVHGPRLSDLMVQSANFSESPAQVRRFLTQLNDLAHNLEHFMLELRIYSRDAPFMSMSDSNVIPLSLVDLQPIASLPKLRGLVLYHARPLNLSEHDLEELLKKLPCITHLRLGSEPFVKPAPRESTLTCAALAIAARCCPRLEALGLFLDTLPPSIPAANTAGSGRFAYLVELDMGCSILDSREVHEMGEYLDHILPPGCTLSYGLAWDEGYPETSLTIEVDESDENWEAVSKLLEVRISS
jgi:hypothetical protein